MTALRWPAAAIAALVSVPAAAEEGGPSLRFLARGAVAGFFQVPAFGGGATVEAGVAHRGVRSYAAVRYLRYETQHALDIHHGALGATVLFALTDAMRLGFTADLTLTTIPRVTRGERMTTMGHGSDLVWELDLASGPAGSLFLDAHAGAELFFWGYQGHGSLGLGYTIPGG